MKVSLTEMGVPMERSGTKNSSVLDILWWEAPIGH